MSQTHKNKDSIASSLMSESTGKSVRGFSRQRQSITQTTPKSSTADFEIRWMPLTEPKSEPFRLTQRRRRSTIAQWNQVQSSAAERSLPA